VSTQTTTQAAARLLLTVEEAAEVLSLGRTTVYNLIRAGDLDSVRIGRARRVSMDALRTFLKERQR
jgi:excisionase family DNA binding protein